jgi:hypothetical protein
MGRYVLILAIGIATSGGLFAQTFPGPRNEEASPQVWLQADYLLWWIKDAPGQNPLVTTGPFDPNTFVPGVTPPPGALTTPGTSVLIGGNSTPLGTFSGLRLQGGIALGGDSCDEQGALGIEGGAFLLERRTRAFSATSNAAGEPFLGRPTIGAVSGLENSLAISFPNDVGNLNGGQSGSAVVINSARLWGGDIGLSMVLLRNQGWKAVGIAGFRYLDLDETLNISESITPFGQPGLFNGNPTPLGSVITGYDNFRTRNQFYGGQLGARVSYQTEMFDLGLTAKVALGNNSQRIGITGATTVQGAGVVLTGPGNIRAQPSNIGVYQRNEFAVLPEVGLNLGVRVMENVRVNVGYSFLYLSRVVRPDGTIDRVVDQTQVSTSQLFVPGAVGTRPLAVFNQTDFWAHGVNFGVSVSY